MARRRRHHRKASRWNKKFGAAAKRAKASCQVEFIKGVRAKNSKVSSIQPYFKCIGRYMKKAL